MVVLSTQKGNKINDLKLHPKLFIDKTTAVYGPSNSGKTVITKTIMNMLKDHFDQIVVVSPSEPNNESYKGTVPKLNIHYSIYLPDPKNPKKEDAKGAYRFFDTIWQRQTLMIAIQKKANNIKVLRQLYNRIDTKHFDRKFKKLKEKKEEISRDIRRRFIHSQAQCKDELQKMDKKITNMLTLLYKQAITPYVNKLIKYNLTEDERYSLNYLEFNPRMLIILDDCAAEFKTLATKEIGKRLFYRGRHAGISLIICCQDDTDLPANIRKNVFVSIFTESIVTSSNFERASNKFSKATKAYITDILPNVFQGWRKFVYIRDDPNKINFYHLTVSEPEPFRFGSSSLWELNKKLENTGVNIDTENPFFNKFRI